MYDTASISLQEYFDSVVFSKDLKYIIPSLLSAISTIIVLIASIMGKFWTRALSTMIFAINAADCLYFMVKLSILLHDPDSDLTCMVMQAMNVFGITSSASWAVLFSHAFYTVLKNRNTAVISSLLKYYIPISFILPILTGFGTFLTNNIHSHGDGVCVYRIYVGEFDWFVLFHLQLPLLFTIALCIIFYILSLRQLRNIVIEGNVTEGLTLIVYPVILIVCWGPLLTMQFIAEFGVNVSPALAKTLRIISHLMGFFNAVVYGEGVKGTLRGCFGSCKKKEEKSPTTTFNINERLTNDMSCEEAIPPEELTKLQCTKVRLDFNLDNDDAGSRCSSTFSSLDQSPAFSGYLM